MENKYTGKILPFNVNILIAEGRSDGLRLVTKTGWNGVGIICPRSNYLGARGHEKFKQCGVYILLGEDEESGTPTIYIGEGDKVLPRLDEHYDKKGFWQQAIVFTSQSNTLNKALVRYLEAKLVEFAHDNKRCKLDNETTPTYPTLSESDKADIEWYFWAMHSLFPVLGVMVFEKPRATIRDSENIIKYQFSGTGFDATGVETRSGFIVHAGSVAVPKLTPHALQKMRGLIKTRQELIDTRVLKKIPNSKGYKFTVDYEFASPSMAAAVCNGNSTNGKIAWKDENGVSFGEHHKIIEESSDEGIKEETK